MARLDTDNIGTALYFSVVSLCAEIAGCRLSNNARGEIIYIGTQKRISYAEYLVDHITKGACK